MAEETAFVRRIVREIGEWIAADLDACASRMEWIETDPATEWGLAADRVRELVNDATKETSNA